jgi:HAMP domain-containing protein
VTTAGAPIAPSTAAQDAARDWQALRADGGIQYGPLPPPEPPRSPAVPEWLRDFARWLGDLLHGILSPVGEFLGVSWPVMRTLGIALAVLAVLMMLWFWVIRPLLDARRARQADEAAEWTPDRAAATALLEDADRLAAEGRFGEAAHLLLQRSVHHIAEARPEWLEPASTAREIAVLPMLPDAARQAFSAISVRVERSLFALRALDAADWQAARAAYADFALQRLPEGA